mgnify:FL=1
MLVNPGSKQHYLCVALSFNVWNAIGNQLKLHLHMFAELTEKTETGMATLWQQVVALDARYNAYRVPDNPQYREYLHHNVTAWMLL